MSYITDKKLKNLHNVSAVYSYSISETNYEVENGIFEFIYAFDNVISTKRYICNNSQPMNITKFQRSIPI